MFRNASMVFSGGMAQNVLWLLQGMITTRALGVKEYGAWGIITAYAALITGIMSLPSANALTRSLVQYRVAGDRPRMALALGSVLVLDLLLATLSVTVILAGAPAAAHRLGDGHYLAAFVVYGAAGLFAFPYNTWYSITRDRQEFGLLSGLPALVTALQLVCTVALWKTGRITVLTLAGIRFGLDLGRAVLLLGLLRRGLHGYGLGLLRLPYTQVWRRRREIGEMWSFVTSVFLSSTAAALTKNIDVLFLGYFRPLAEVGLFRLAKQFVDVVLGAAGGLMTAIYQDFNELLAAGQYREAIRAIRRLSGSWAPLAVVCGLLVGLATKPLIVLLFGPDFVAAAPAFRWMLAGITANVAFFWAHSLLLAVNEHRYFLWMTLALGFLTIPALWLGARFGGALGTSMVTMVYWWTWTWCTARRGVRKLHERAALPPGSTSDGAAAPVPFASPGEAGAMAD